jgi:hypothetical protein
VSPAKQRSTFGQRVIELNTRCTEIMQLPSRPRVFGNGTDSAAQVAKPTFVDSFERLERRLLDLEQEQFERLREEVRWTQRLASCASGAVQFYSIDDEHRGEGELPVVCLVGINYTQEPKRKTEAIVHFGARTPPVVTNRTATRRQPRFVVAAYNRNRHAWTATPGIDPPSPLVTYGVPNATSRSGLTAAAVEEVGPFILMMTNVTPFITQKRWQDQVKETPEACAALANDKQTHLDALFQKLGDSIDLWIGHSAIEGTRWVWPHFANFVQRHRIEEWLLCGNINAQAHLWHDGAFRKPSHRLYEWYK